MLEHGEKYSLNEDGTELLIKDVRKVDEGEYACIAKNKAGEKAGEVSLNVFGKRWRAASQPRAGRTSNYSCVSLGLFSSAQNHLPEQRDGLRVRQAGHADLRGVGRPHAHHLLELRKQGVH